MSGRRAVSALALAALATGCATNPATGRRQFNLIGEGQEIAMGQQADKDIVRSMGLYPDEDLQRYVHDLGTSLAKDSERPELPWTFRVVDDPVVNAFALPGGYIYVTRGILAHLSSEAELAGVLGHEIGHVTGKHGVNRMSKAQVATLGLGVGMIVKPELAEQFGGLAQNGLGLLFLKYGRDDEREADDLGLRYIQRQAYDPRPMANVFEVLKRVSASAGAGRVPDWMSTHPNPDERMQRVRANIAAEGRDLRGTKVNKESYIRRLDGMVFGQDPREGFFEGSDFFHPGMAFRFRVPEGWNKQNQKDAVIAVSQEQDAMLRLTLSPADGPSAAANEFLKQQNVRGTGQRARIGGLEAVIVEFEAQSQSGVLNGAVAFIRHNNATFELLGVTPAELWRSRGRSIQDSIESFRRVTDRRILDVQPARLEVVQMREGMSLERFTERYPSSAPPATIGLINHLDPGEPVPDGALMKRVLGGTGRGN